MGSGTWTWTRAKRWMKHGLFTAFWPVERSHLFVKLRSLVSQSLVPVSLCGAGAGLDVLAASAVAFPVGYGALAGTAAMTGALGLVELHARLVAPQQASRFVGVFRSRRETSSERLMFTETTVRGKGKILRR